MLSVKHHFVFFEQFIFFAQYIERWQEIVWNDLQRNRLLVVVWFGSSPALPPSLLSGWQLNIFWTTVEFGSGHHLAGERVCLPPPLGSWGGGHRLASGGGGGGTQFRRKERHCGILYKLWTHYVHCTLQPEFSLDSATYSPIAGQTNYIFLTKGSLRIFINISSTCKFQRITYSKFPTEPCLQTSRPPRAAFYLPCPYLGIYSPPPSQFHFRGAASHINLE